MRCSTSGEMEAIMKKMKILHGISFIITLIIFVKLSKLIAFVFILFYVVVINYPTILCYIGNHKFASNNMEQSKKYFLMVCKCFYSSPKLKISCCYFLLLQGELDDADRIVKGLLGENLTSTDKVNLEIDHSLIAWKRNKIDESINILVNLYNDYKTTVIYQNLGYFLILKGDYEKSLEFNLEAYEYNSSDSGILDNLAQNYYSIGNYDRAIELYEKLMEKNPSFPTAYYYYALTLIEKNKLNEAIRNLKKALNCKFTYLSIIKKNVIQQKILELEMISND